MNDVAPVGIGTAASSDSTGRVRRAAAIRARILLMVVLPSRWLCSLYLVFAARLTRAAGRIAAPGLVVCHEPDTRSHFTRCVRCMTDRGPDLCYTYATFPQPRHEVAYGGIRGRPAVGSNGRAAAHGGPG